MYASRRGVGLVGRRRRTVSRPSDDVEVVCLLQAVKAGVSKIYARSEDAVNQPDELGDEFRLYDALLGHESLAKEQRAYVVGKIGVHDDHKVARAEVEPMNIRRPA